jgi:tetratricopeptide (TPR) repeat protein
MAHHAFVAMPFGIKEDIDFNAVFRELIKPALEGAGFEVFRADEEMRAGNIRTDMFQELLLADLVVADLSIDNPNVWYELGVRHALRKRGVVQITCRRDQMPFDLLTERSVRYRTTIKSAVAIPDPQYVEDDKKKLAEVATQTIHAWYGRKVSPVYHLLPYLDEPDWKSLRIEEAREFWEQYENWAERIEIARRGNRPGDILVLAGEAPTRVFHLEALQKAGRALLSLGQFKFALAQYEEALAIRPKDLESRRQKCLLLGRLKKHDDAKECIEDLIDEFPQDAESWAMRGRLEKDAWVDCWKQNGRSVVDMRREAEIESGILHEAINAYATGFRKDPAHYYSGINAVTLLHLLAHLSADDLKADVRAEMEGGVRWAIRGALERNPKDYWARISLAELEVLMGARQAIDAAYKNAVAVADKDWFKLNSSCQQLELLRLLGFRPEEVETAVAILDRALSRLNPPDKTWTPQQVVLFSGHMIDAPDRPEPRFPVDKEKVAAAAIAATLEKLNAGADDVALCGGACGGDLLFAEAALERGVKLELRLAFDEPTFLQKSVSFAPGNWTERYFKVKSHPNTTILVMPEVLGELPPAANPFARLNLWQLYTSLAWGPEKVRFVCLWNRKGGDGPGGTQHMFETVQKYSGRVYVIDTTTLW